MRVQVSLHTDIKLKEKFVRLSTKEIESKGITCIFLELRIKLVDLCYSNLEKGKIGLKSNLEA